MIGTSAATASHDASRRRHTAYIVVIGLALTLIFALDSLTPLGISTWFSYILPLALSSYLSARRAPFIIAGLSSILTLLDYVTSPFLLVDDLRFIREAIRKLLEEWPAIELVGEAEDGLSAVEMAFLLHPDVIIMDIQMPRLDGVEATRQITSALPETAVIGLSVNYDALTHGMLAETGATAFLPKEQAYRLPQTIAQVTGRHISRHHSG